MDNANNNVPPSEMIVDVRPVLDHIGAWRGAWVVSTCVGRNGRINKRWIEPLRDGQIKCGSLGVFNGDIFEQQQDYYDAKYDIVTVESINPKAIGFNQGIDFVTYNVYSPKHGFDGISSQRLDVDVLGGYSCDIACVGNNLLLDKDDRILANLTTEENIYDLWNGRNLKKYNLRLDRDGTKRKYRTVKYPYESIGMPAVMLGHGIGNVNTDFVFIPEYNKGSKCDIHIEGLWQPMPRPSDIVLLEATEQENVFVLKKNLTLYCQNQEMDKKFGLVEYQNKMRRVWEKALRNEHQ